MSHDSALDAAPATAGTRDDQHPAEVATAAIEASPPRTDGEALAGVSHATADGGSPDACGTPATVVSPRVSSPGPLLCLTDDASLCPAPLPALPNDDSTAIITTLDTALPNDGINVAVGAAADGEPQPVACAISSDSTSDAPVAPPQRCCTAADNDDCSGTPARADSSSQQPIIITTNDSIVVAAACERSAAGTTIASGDSPASQPVCSDELPLKRQRLEVDDAAHLPLHTAATSLPLELPPAV